jgi:hypothetical protein
VSPHDTDTGLSRLIRTPTQDIGHDGEGEARVIRRKPDDVEGDERNTPHRIDVTHRIRRSDLPKSVRIVNDRREVVNGQNERLIAGDPVDGGVIRRCRADEDVRVIQVW